MPLYDYACDDCGTKFEKLVRKESEAANLDCPSCGGMHINRELSLPAAPMSSQQSLPTACGVGPPCGAPRCGRKG